MTIPFQLAIEMGIKKGVVLQIKKHKGWIAVRVDPSQEPVTEEPPAEESRPVSQEPDAKEGPEPSNEPPKDEPPKDIPPSNAPPKKDNRICGFDGL